MEYPKDLMYEVLILKIWDKSTRCSDPFGLADADTYDSQIKKLSKEILFSLEAGLLRLKNIWQNSEHLAFIEEMVDDFHEIKTSEDFDTIVSKTYNCIIKEQL